jgi:hypothetical protein
MAGVPSITSAYPASQAALEWTPPAEPRGIVLPVVVVEKAAVAWSLAARKQAYGIDFHRRPAGKRRGR